MRPTEDQAVEIIRGSKRSKQFLDSVRLSVRFVGGPRVHAFINCQESGLAGQFVVPKAAPGSRQFGHAPSVAEPP